MLNDDFDKEQNVQLRVRLKSWLIPSPKSTDSEEPRIESLMEMHSKERGPIISISNIMSQKMIVEPITPTFEPSLDRK